MPCSYLMQDCPEKAEEIIMKWAKEHPANTNLEEFCKHFGISKLDWKTIKEEAIKFFLEEECKYDFFEDIPQTIPNAT